MDVCKGFWHVELEEGSLFLTTFNTPFVVVGFGDTVQVATEDHDNNLKAFLHRCVEKGVSGKIKPTQPEVPFIGHIATSEGLSKLDQSNYRNATTH